MMTTTTCTPYAMRRERLSEKKTLRKEIEGEKTHIRGRKGDVPERKGGKGTDGMFPLSVYPCTREKDRQDLTIDNQ